MKVTFEKLAEKHKGACQYVVYAEREDAEHAADGRFRVGWLYRDYERGCRSVPGTNSGWSGYWAWNFSADDEMPNDVQDAFGFLNHGEQCVEQQWEKQAEARAELEKAFSEEAVQIAFVRSSTSEWKDSRDARRVYNYVRKQLGLPALRLPPPDPLDALTEKQRATLIAYARAHGAQWKAHLRADWRRAGSTWHGEWSYLQQIRNGHGPSWLMKVPRNLYKQPEKSTSSEGSNDE